MRQFKWIAGISILLILVASALPAYSAKPWPQGGDKGPQVDIETYIALEVITTCTDDVTLAQDLFDAVAMHIDGLGYTQNGKDAKFGAVYPMPITSSEEESIYKDQAAMAWDTYHAMYDYDQGKDVTAKIDSVIVKFLSNVSHSDDPVVIIDGGRIFQQEGGADLQTVFDDLVALYNCVAPVE